MCLSFFGQKGMIDFVIATVPFSSFNLERYDCELQKSNNELDFRLKNSLFCFEGYRSTVEDLR